MKLRALWNRRGPTVKRTFPLLAALLLHVLAAACGAKHIPNTRVPDTSDDRFDFVGARHAAPY